MYHAQRHGQAIRRATRTHQYIKRKHKACQQNSMNTSRTRCRSSPPYAWRTRLWKPLCLPRRDRYRRVGDSFFQHRRRTRRAGRHSDKSASGGGRKAPVIAINTIITKIRRNSKTGSRTSTKSIVVAVRLTLAIRTLGTLGVNDTPPGVLCLCAPTTLGDARIARLEVGRAMRRGAQ